MIKVFYDNECSFCRTAKFFFNKLDYFNIFSWFPAIDKQINEIDSNVLNSTIVVMSKSNKLLIEFEACRYIMTRIPLFYPLIILLYIPFISSYFGNKLYRIVSKNRKCQ